MTPTAEHAVERTLTFEGPERTNYPMDYGGDTKWGISKRWHPEVDLDHLTRDDAGRFLWLHYWQPLQLDRLMSPDVAARVFDAAVLCGTRRAVQLLQRAVRACGRDVEEDGDLGPQTVAAEAECDARSLVPAMRAEVAGYHRIRAAMDPTQAVFLKGWLSRAYS
jgi:lysozyme family protein